MVSVNPSTVHLGLDPESNPEYLPFSELKNLMHKKLVHQFHGTSALTALQKAELKPARAVFSQKNVALAASAAAAADPTSVVSARTVAPHAAAGFATKVNASESETSDVSRAAEESNCSVKLLRERYNGRIAAATQGSKQAESRSASASFTKKRALFAVERLDGARSRAAAARLGVCSGRHQFPTNGSRGEGLAQSCESGTPPGSVGAALKKIDSEIYARQRGLARRELSFEDLDAVAAAAPAERAERAAQSASAASASCAAESAAAASQAVAQLEMCAEQDSTALLPQRAEQPAGAPAPATAQPQAWTEAQEFLLLRRSVPGNLFIASEPEPAPGLLADFRARRGSLVQFANNCVAALRDFEARGQEMLRVSLFVYEALLATAGGHVVGDVDLATLGVSRDDVNRWLVDFSCETNLTRKIVGALPAIQADMLALRSKLSNQVLMCEGLLRQLEQVSLQGSAAFVKSWYVRARAQYRNTFLLETREQRMLEICSGLLTLMRRTDFVSALKKFFRDRQIQLDLVIAANRYTFKLQRAAAR